jgi:hydrogenase/urease accessory protein HupE
MSSVEVPTAGPSRPPGLLAACLAAILLLTLSGPALAHAVAEGDKGYIQEITGVHFLPFMYMGAKHMVTGYDHLLFLAGVIFFLYRMRDVGLYQAAEKGQRDWASPLVSGGGGSVGRAWPEPGMRVPWGADVRWPGAFGGG